jgi:AraC-like DNA-binding protein
VSCLLAEWRWEPDKAASTTVIPDGCRDLIVRVRGNARPEWLLSPLETGSFDTGVKAGVYLRGYRLKPGTQVDATRLLAMVEGRSPDAAGLIERIEENCTRPPETAEALACLADGTGSVTGKAAQLGVSERTLQRMLHRTTGQTPGFWLKLARIRRAARDILQPLPLAEVAYSHGFADQAHMSREFRRWLNISPARLKADTAISSQLRQPGFA